MLMPSRTMWTAFNKSSMMSALFTTLEGSQYHFPDVVLRVWGQNTKKPSPGGRFLSWKSAMTFRDLCILVVFRIKLVLNFWASNRMVLTHIVTNGLLSNILPLFLSN